MQQTLIAFTFAATLLTLTPGLDTALVLRTAAAEGRRAAAFAACGILLGLGVWGALVALGVAALLSASALAFALLKWAGGAYLVWVGARLLLKPRAGWTGDVAATTASAGAGDRGPLVRGAMTNLLNPKVGVFYVSFLPQFTPPDVNAAGWTLLLVAIHATMGLIWFAVLIAAAAPLGGWLKQAAVVRWMDRAVGALFLAFGVKLALAR